MRHFANAQHLRHHAFAIEDDSESGVETALAWIEPYFAKGYEGHGGIRSHPDVVILQYGLFSVEDARRVGEIAMQGPIAGETKVIIIAASRAYREAQNALLKLFEEPPASTYLFLILPTLGGLLPTLRSRLHVLQEDVRTDVRTPVRTSLSPLTEEFLQATREKRGAIVKKLVAGKDEEERRAHRDEALAIVNGIEAAVYHVGRPTSHIRLLGELQTLRGYLHERSAPVRMILEHLAIVTPKIQENGTQKTVNRS